MRHARQVSLRFFSNKLVRLARSQHRQRGAHAGIGLHRVQQADGFRDRTIGGKTSPAGALLATFAVGLNLKEETYKECDIVSYFFSETKKVEGDPTNIRFNFSPSYVTVGGFSNKDDGQIRRLQEQLPKLNDELDPAIRLTARPAVMEIPR